MSTALRFDEAPQPFREARALAGGDGDADGVADAGVALDVPLRKQVFDPREVVEFQGAGDGDGLVLGVVLQGVVHELHVGADRIAHDGDAARLGLGVS